MASILLKVNEVFSHSVVQNINNSHQEQKMFKWTNIISSKIKRHRPIGDKRRKPNNVIPEGVTTKQSQWRIVEAKKGEKNPKKCNFGKLHKG